MTRIAIDPITRIEGHLRLEVEQSDGRVHDVWSSGTMFRGIELIVNGRDPREAWIFAQRACGVCTHVHALASVRAVENALGLTIPPNARIIRNILAATLQVHDHTIHFYHLHALDWVDVTASLSADPAATSALAKANNPNWANNTTAWFTQVQSQLKAYVGSGQLGPYSNGYWGHPAYRFTPEQSLLLMAHYLEALDWQRDVIKIHSILGGKNPHPQTYVVGGMSLGFGPAVPTGANPANLITVSTLAAKAKVFVDAVVVPDMVLLAKVYRDPWANLGVGVGNYLAYGDYPETHPTRSDNSDETPSPSRRSEPSDGEDDHHDQPANVFFPGGRVVGMDLGRVLPVDQMKVAETVAASWYSYTGGDNQLLHPWSGQTNPHYTGPTPPYKMIDTAEYSWLKAPRYDGVVYEVGPLARLSIGYASGRQDIRSAVDHFLTAAGFTRRQWFSTLGRMAARTLESQLIATRLVAWAAELQANLAAGDLRIADTTKWDPSTWPTRAQGFGTVEAPRGALGHWVKIDHGKVSGYQMVVPTTWNGSPRDGKGQRGAWEQALIGTPLVDPNRPVEVLRTVHSFDPCMGCSVHLHDPDGAETVAITVV